MVAERLRELADELDPAGAQPRSAAAADREPVPTPRAGGAPAAAAPSGSAAARLLATQMAVSGSSRKEIEARLRNGFEIEDTERDPRRDTRTGGVERCTTTRPG